MSEDLQRQLSFADLLIYGMIFMVPTAPMAVYGMVAQESHGMVPFVYLVGMVAMLFTAWSYSLMSREFPLAGSVYAYVQRGWNAHIGFLCGWMILADYFLLPALLYDLSGVWLHSLLPTVPQGVWVLLFLAAITWINVRGITWTAGANKILLALELAALLLFVGWAVYGIWGKGYGTAGWSWAPLCQPEIINPGFIATAASIAVLSFLGFDAVSTLAEETKQPDRMVGKATIATLLVLGMIFMAQTYLAALLHPDYHTLNRDTAFFDVAGEAAGSWLSLCLILVSVIATGIANALAAQTAVSRVLFAMARDGQLPLSSWLGRVHPRYRTPAASILSVALLTVVVTWLVPLEEILKLINFGALTSFLVLHLTVIIYFFGKKKRRGGKGFIHFVLLPATGFVIIAYVWLGFGWETWLAGLVWLALGVLVGVMKKSWKGVQMEA